MTDRKSRPPLSQTKVDNIGHAAAKLHRLLKELGHARGLQQSAATMPDARNRLSFIDQTCMRPRKGPLARWKARCH